MPNVSPLDVVYLHLSDIGWSKVVLWLLGGAFFIFLSSWGVARFGARHRYILRSPLSRQEQRMYKLLERAVPEFYIFPQVGFQSILDTPHSGDRMKSVARIMNKKSSFLVCDRQFNPLVSVEIDAWGGAEQGVQLRKEEILTEVGLPTLHVRWRKTMEEADIRKSLLQKSKRARQIIRKAEEASGMDLQSDSVTAQETLYNDPPQEGTYGVSQY